MREISFDKRDISKQLLDSNITVSTQMALKDSDKRWVNQKNFLLKQKDSVTIYDDQQLNNWFNKNVFLAETHKPDTFWLNQDHAPIKLQYKTDNDNKYKVTMPFTFKWKNADRNVSFILKYPAFGVWIIIVFANVVFWFMILLAVPSGMISLYNTVKTLHITATETLNISFTRIVFSFIVALLIVFCFAYCLMQAFNVITFVQGGVFFENFSRVNYFLFYFGYIVAGVCLAEFLVCAYFMFQIFETDNFKNKEQAFLDKYILCKKQLNTALLIASVTKLLYFFSRNFIYEDE